MKVAQYTPGARFGANLRKYRIAANMVQREVAFALSITGASYSRWESGEALPDPFKLKRVCKVLGIDPNTLLEWEL